ncbi:MAG: hypothetical protein ABFD65_01295, partial [Candidatus Polarisedimenticolia bacterium]
LDAPGDLFLRAGREALPRPLTGCARVSTYLPETRSERRSTLISESDQQVEPAPSKTEESGPDAGPHRLTAEVRQENFRQMVARAPKALD